MNSVIQKTIKDLDVLQNKLSHLHGPKAHGGGGHGGDHIKIKQKEIAAIQKLENVASKKHEQHLKHEHSHAAKEMAHHLKAHLQHLKHHQKHELKEVEEHEKATTELKKIHHVERLANEKSASDISLAGISDALKKVSQEHKVAGEARKAVMIGQAMMGTFNAAVGAFNQGMGMPPPFGLAAAPIMMGMAITAGMGNVAQISSQKFEQGGPVLGPSHSNGGVPAVLEGGEYIVPRNTVAKMGGFQGIENAVTSANTTHQTVAPMLNVHVKGNADGGAVNTVKGSVRQELQGMARNLRLLGVKPTGQGYYMTRA